LKTGRVVMGKRFFHQNMLASVNSKGSSLLLELKPLKGTHNKPSFSSEVIPSAVIKESDLVGRFLLNSHSSQSFMFNGQQIGVEGEAYLLILKLSEQIQRCPRVRDTVSIETVSTNVFRWMEIRYTGESNQELSEHLENVFIDAIKKLKVYIPVAATFLEREILIGQVSLQPLSSAIIKEWRKVCPVVPEQEDDVNKLFDEISKKFQGYAVGVIEIESEPDYATQLGLREVEKVLSLLRIFSPTNINPQAICPTTVKGKEYTPTTEAIIVGSDSFWQNSSSLKPGFGHWSIPAEMIQIMEDDGLLRLGQILNSETNTPFQDKVLNALMIYSKSSQETEVEAKLIYIFSAIESLLLKNENEPIQQNISERMAFIVCGDPISRKELIKCTKAAYGLRSKFFHHGHNMSESEVLTEFFTNVWIFFMSVIKNIDKFETKEAFLEALDNIKLGG
jgi:hypothetical protein